MMYLACYDIENDRIRSRLADKLLAIGLERIQFSVFVGPLTDPQKAKLISDTEKMLGDLPRTNFLLIPLTPTNVTGTYHWGDAPPDWEYLTGQKLTLIL